MDKESCSLKFHISPIKVLDFIQFLKCTLFHYMHWLFDSIIISCLPSFIFHENRFSPRKTDVENAKKECLLGIRKALSEICQQLDMSRDHQLFLGKTWTFYFRVRAITPESRRLATRLNDFAHDLWQAGSGIDKIAGDSWYINDFAS